MLSRFQALFAKKQSPADTGKKPNPSSKNLARSVKNWYADRYLAITLQRNFLFIFAIVASVSVLFALIMVKTMYEQRAIDPYILEVEPKSGIVTVIDEESLKSYTGQEIVKESLIIKYIKTREGFRSETVEDDQNYVRVMSSKIIYDIYKNNQSTADEIRRAGRGAYAVIKLRGKLDYTTPTRVQFKFSRLIYVPGEQEVRVKKFTGFLSFNFIDSKVSMELDDRYINPLGFQVISYGAQSEVEDKDES